MSHQQDPFSIEVGPGRLFVPDSEQKNTSGILAVDLPEFSVTPPADLVWSDYGSDIESSAILQRAQQVLFLPNFVPTDYMFYGEGIDSRESRNGIPTVRSGKIKGANFSLTITENYNLGGLFLLLNFAKQELGISSYYIKPGHVEDTVSFAEWLDAQLLSPILVELMSNRPN